MAKQDYYTDPSGEKVPAKYVKPYDRLRDKIARQIEKDWQAEQARLAACKVRTVAAIQKLQEAAAAEAGVDLGGEKGNLQFRSFDGSITISLDRQYRTEFDERLQFAQALIKEAVAEMTEGTDADLAEIATKAFTPRKTGNLDMQRIRDLRTYNVSHPKWRQACEIISDCERTIAFRDYIRVAVRPAPNAKPQPITLDIASL
jgi:hypothetical protein